MKGVAKLIREKKEELHHWQGQARMETRWLRETTKICNKIQKEIEDLQGEQTKASHIIRIITTIRDNG